MSERYFVDNVRKWRFWWWQIAGVAAFSVVIAIVFVTRVLRCVAYHKFVSTGSFSGNLAASVSDVDIAAAKQSVPLDFGYGQLALPEGWAVSISTKWSPVSVSIVGEGNEILVLMRPHYDSRLSADGNYSHFVEATQTRQVTLEEVFRMPSNKFENLMRNTWHKGTNNFNQNGIGLFQTEHVRASSVSGRPASRVVSISKFGRWRDACRRGL